MADPMDIQERSEGAYLAGDLVRDADGKAYLVTWTNQLPSGELLDTLAVLALRDDLETVYDYLDIEVSKVVDLVPGYLSFDDARRSFWTYIAANM